MADKWVINNQSSIRLSSGQNVIYDEGTCNNNTFTALFNLIDDVGVIHTLCGLSVLDDVMEKIR